MNKDFDIVQTFLTSLSHFLIKVNHQCPLIRKHKEKLSTCGEFSFPVNFNYWFKYVNSDYISEDFAKGDGRANSKTILEYSRYLNNGETSVHKNDATDIVQLVLQNIVECSKTWSLNVIRCAVQYERVQLFLDRTQTFRDILHLILSKKSMYGKASSQHKIVTVTSDTLRDKEVMDLSEKRIELLRNTTVKLLESVGCEVATVSSDKSSVCLHFLTKSSVTVQDNCQKVLCGVVVNSKYNSKESNMTAQEYFRQRCDDMRTMAEHKYNSNMNELPTKWDEFLSHLGEAAMTMDLLQVKPSHTVSLNLDSNSGSRETSSRGAAFALYNCARVSAILRQYEEKVQEGYYPHLIPFEEVDFSLLVQEEEWNLLFLYLLSYPNLLSHSVENVEQGKVSPNLLCNFIMGMCSTFSIYYRRVRILTEPRSQLMPVMFARLYLLQATQQVLHNALGMLGIPPLLHM